MATVYLARDLRHERNVALKVLKPELAQAISDTSPCNCCSSGIGRPGKSCVNTSTIKSAFGSTRKCLVLIPSPA